MRLTLSASLTLSGACVPPLSPSTRRCLLSFRSQPETRRCLLCPLALNPKSRRCLLCPLALNPKSRRCLFCPLALNPKPAAASSLSALLSLALNLSLALSPPLALNPKPAADRLCLASSHPLTRSRSQPLTDSRAADRLCLASSAVWAGQVQAGKEAHGPWTGRKGRHGPVVQTCHAGYRQAGKRFRKNRQESGWIIGPQVRPMPIPRSTTSSTATSPSIESLSRDRLTLEQRLMAKKQAMKVGERER